MTTDGRTTEQLLSDVREALRIAEMAHNDHVVGNADVASLVARLEYKRAVVGELLDYQHELLGSLKAFGNLNRRALAIITDAIMHGLPITEEVAAVRNAILNPTVLNPKEIDR